MSHGYASPLGSNHHTNLFMSPWPNLRTLHLHALSHTAFKCRQLVSSTKRTDALNT